MFWETHDGGHPKKQVGSGASETPTPPPKQPWLAGVPRNKQVLKPRTTTTTTTTTGFETSESVSLISRKVTKLDWLILNNYYYYYYYYYHH